MVRFKENLSVLIIDEDDTLYTTYKDSISFGLGQGLIWEYCGDYQQSKSFIETQKYDIYILNSHVENRSTVSFIKNANEKQLPSPIIMMGSDDDELENNAILYGAANYLDKTILNKKLISRAIKYAKDRYDVQNELVKVKEAKEKDLISLQQQNQNLIDSIIYAKNIQDILLVDRENLINLFGEFLILYEPKDIISGDFYFSTFKNNLKYLAVSDCTGHGVPGALMTIYCNDLLKQGVQHHVLPHEILNYINKKLTYELKQYHEPKIKDGMDIGLFAIDEEKQIIYYSGAYRPLVITSTSEEQINIVEANKRHVGISGFSKKDNQSFILNTIEYKKGDRLFLFTDGITDQFDKTQSKKFSKRKLIQLLEDTKGLPIVQQSQQINKEFLNWKGNSSQTDDAMMIGIAV